MNQSDIEEKKLIFEKGKSWLEANILVDSEGKKIHDKHEKKNLLETRIFSLVYRREKEEMV